MLDQQGPGEGHNLPPAFEQHVVDEHAATVQQFMQATKTWLDMGDIETETHAGQLADQITGLRGLYKDVDTARKAAKKPHDDAGKAVQAAFTPLLKQAETAANQLKEMLGRYAAKKAAEEAEKLRKQEEAARKAAEEADAERKAAEDANDIAAQQAADAKAEEAAAVAARAAAGPDTKVKSGSGAGRTMSMRTIREVEITNPRLAFMRYQEHPKVLEALRMAASEEVRAASFDPKTKIDGVTINERQVMA